jgi:hypothetical protein
MEIPYQKLAPAVLRAVIEEFVTREGTDYGANDFSLDSKVAQVIRQLDEGSIFLSYDSQSGSCHLRKR